MDPETTDILHTLNLSEYIRKFTEEAIGIEELKDLNQDLLKELLPKIGHRIRLDNYIKLNFPPASLDRTTSNASTIIIHDSLDQTAEDNLNCTTESDITPPSKIPKLGLFQGAKTADEFIQSSRIGQAIIASYETSKSLTKGDRTRLVHILADDLVETHEKLGNRQLSVIADAIIKIFPSEVKGTYYIPPENARKISGGRIIERFRNQRKILSKAAKLNNSNNFEPDKTEECLESLSWLQSSCDPWNKVIHHWENTIEARKNDKQRTIFECYRNYPALTMPLGYKLLEIDFDALYPGKDGLLEGFNAAASKLWTLIIQNRNTGISGSYEDYESNEVRDLALLRALAGYFPAALHKNSGGFYRPSAKECQDGFIMIVKDATDIKQRLAERKNKCAKLETTAQPIVIAVCPSDDKIQSTHIHVDNTTYTTHGILKSIDISFKVHMALNAEYSVESRQVYLFLQTHYYKIKTVHDKMSSAISNMIGLLQA